MAKSKRRDSDTIAVPKHHINKQNRHRLSKSLREVVYTFDEHEDLDEYYDDLLADETRSEKKRLSA